MDCIVVAGPDLLAGFGLGEIERALDALVREVPKYFNARVEHVLVVGRHGVALRAWEWAVNGAMCATTVAPETVQRDDFRPFAVAVLPGADQAAVDQARQWRRPVLVWSSGAGWQRAA